MRSNKGYCLFTVIYPGVEKVFSGFIQSVERLCEDVDCFVFDHGSNMTIPDDFIKIMVDPALSIAGVRAFMFSYLKDNTDAKHYFFTDSDDRVHPKAIQRHAAALMHADFSYGDQQLYLNDFSNSLDTTLFEIMRPPQTLNLMSDLLKGNCVGLSALGMNRKCLELIPQNFPENIPLLDWWIALTLLGKGMKGARADVVTDYCLNDAAYNRAQAASTFNELERRIKTIEIILNALNHNHEIDGYMSCIQDLKTALLCSPDTVKKAMKEVSEKKLMWYQDVFEISHLVSKKNKEG